MTARLLLVLCAGAMTLGLVPAQTGATPAFSRRHQVACATCHTSTYPELNRFGRRFAENGYRMPPPEEARADERALLRPGHADRLALWRELPLSVQLQSSAVLPTRDTLADQRSALDLRMLERVHISLGGPVSARVSSFLSLSLGPELSWRGAVSVQALVPGEALTIRAGRLSPLDFVRPGHREPTRQPSPAASVRAGLNPTLLDAPQPGIDLHGRAGCWLFYRVAVLSGATGDDGVSDIDSHKDILGELHLVGLKRLVAGALLYAGRTQITDEHAGVVVRFTDPFWLASGFVDVLLGRVSLFAQLTHARHHDPFGVNLPVHYLTMRADAAVELAPAWRLITRWDQVLASGDDELALRAATVHLAWQALDHLRLALESHAVLSHIPHSSLSLTLDLAF